MKLRLKVTPIEGEPYEVTTSLWVITQYERKMKVKAGQLAQGIGAEDLACLAHFAAQQHQITVPLLLDDFIKKVENIEVLDDEPTRPT